jgi:hypothetical protein
LMRDEVTGGFLKAAWGSPRPCLTGRLPGQAARGVAVVGVPWMAIAGSQTRPVVTMMMACGCRRIAAAITA